MREVFEIGAQWSVSARDVPSFERYMSMLKSVYTDQSKTLPESSRMYELLGLNLLCLLSQNRLSDFHTELELLPPEILLENPYIENPVQLEQFIMEGKYNKVIDTRYNVPAESYKFFIDVLLVTIRDEIGKNFFILDNVLDISTFSCRGPGRNFTQGGQNARNYA